MKLDPDVVISKQYREVTWLRGILSFLNFIFYQVMGIFFLI